jgi:homoserine dehydrogenase
MNPTLVVLKFGSSVLPDRDCLPAVVHEIYRHYRRNEQVLVVVSAIGRHTEALLDAARHWSNPPSPDTALAELLATGERQSAALLAMALERAGIAATLLNPAAIRLTLRGDRLDAMPVDVDVKSIRRALQATPVVVIPGFAGVHEDGGTALMGRGGSDLTAVFLAQALAAAQCRLVKDVDGIYDRDPAAAIATDATDDPPHRYREVTYEDALRVSGALVQPKAIDYLRENERTARVAGLMQTDGTDIGAPATTVCDRPPAAPLKVLLLGLGTVGQGVYDHLQRLGAFFEVIGIHVRDVNKTRDCGLPPGLLSADIGALLARPYQIVVDVCGDAAQVTAAIEASLVAGRPAVSASKRRVAGHGAALSRLAAKNGTRFCYSAAVGGAAPMLEVLEHALQQGAITRLRGVLNGTCNFVLDRLSQGVAFHTAVSEARRRGFAEANVSRDLHDDDSADKLRILARLAFGAAADAPPITCEGLSPTSAGHIVGRAEGSVLRQVATFDPSTGGAIRLERLPAADYLTGACGEQNRLIISGAEGREWRVNGKGAGRWPTAEAVLADLLELHAWLGSRAAKAAPGTADARPRRRRRATAA